MAYKRAWKGQTDEPVKNSSEKYSDYVEGFNTKMVELLEKNEAPWQKPWNPGEMGSGLPYNATTGKSYSGSNSLWLVMEQAKNGYVDDRWSTFNQGKDLGAFVRKGEKGTQLVKWVEVEEKKEGQAAQAPKADGVEKDTRMVPVLFTVFNAAQFESFPPAPERKLVSEHERHERCEQLIKDSGVQINYNGGNRAYYRPSTDSVHLPAKDQFKTADGLYATTLHELGHATGHPSRLGRDLSGRFGSESYAREELNAELFSMMAGQRLGIGHDPSQHAAYLQSWIKIVKEDPKAILNACRNAEKICEHLGVEKYEHQATQKVEQQEAQEVMQQPDQLATKANEQVAERPRRKGPPSLTVLPRPVEHRRSSGSEHGISL